MLTSFHRTRDLITVSAGAWCWSLIGARWIQSGQYHSHPIFIRRVLIIYSYLLLGLINCLSLSSVLNKNSGPFLFSSYVLHVRSTYLFWSDHNNIWRGPTTSEASRYVSLQYCATYSLAVASICLSTVENDLIRGGTADWHVSKLFHCYNYKNNLK